MTKSLILNDNDKMLKDEKKVDWALNDFTNLIKDLKLKPITSQSAFTCSKLTIETLEQGVK